MGVIFTIIAGSCITIQNVFNTRLQEKIGGLETTAFVHGLGFLFALVVAFFFGKGDLKNLGQVNKLYLSGGIFGVVIVLSIIRGVSALGSTLSTLILMFTQILISLLIDRFGFFGMDIIHFNSRHFMGLLVALVGILIFNFA